MSHPTINWLFEINSPEAARVYLVAEGLDGSTRTIAMNPSESGRWTTRLPLPPDRYLFHYFESDGRTLTAARTTGLRVSLDRSRHSTQSTPCTP